MSKKKPDLVVWEEEKGYYSKELTYGSNVGAQQLSWKMSKVGKTPKQLIANKQFKTKYEELKEEFRKLVDEVNWNELVYSSSYSFIPVMNEVYHLYMRKDDTTFLSLIHPTQWKQDYVGSFKLDSTQKWIKVEI